MTCRGPRTCRMGFSRRTDSANARTARSSVTHCSPCELWVQSISSRWHDSLIRLATESLLRDSSTSTLPATRECCSCASRCRRRVCLKRTSRRASIDVVSLATSISVTSFVQAPTDSCFILLCPAGLARPRLRSRSIFAETRTGLTTRLTNSPPESVRKVGVEAPPPSIWHIHRAKKKLTAAVSPSANTGNREWLPANAFYQAYQPRATMSFGLRRQRE